MDHSSHHHHDLQEHSSSMMMMTMTATADEDAFCHGSGMIMYMDGACVPLLFECFSVQSDRIVALLDLFQQSSFR